MFVERPKARKGDQVLINGRWYEVEIVDEMTGDVMAIGDDGEQPLVGTYWVPASAIDMIERDGVRL